MPHHELWIIWSDPICISILSFSKRFFLQRFIRHGNTSKSLSDEHSHTSSRNYIYLFHSGRKYLSFSLNILCKTRPNIFMKTNSTFTLVGIVRALMFISSPFMHLRWLLFKLNMDKTNAYILNGVLFTILFFFSRIFIIIPLWAHVYSLIEKPDWSRLTKIDIFNLALNSSFDVLNLIWFREIVKLLGKVLQKRE